VRDDGLVERLDFLVWLAFLETLTGATPPLSSPAGTDLAC